MTLYDTKGTQKGPRKGESHRKHVPIQDHGLISALDPAIKEGRAPTEDELWAESRIIIGKCLMGLLSSGDVYKTCTAINNVVKSLSIVSTASVLKDILPDKWDEMDRETLMDNIRDNVIRTNKMVSN